MLELKIQIKKDLVKLLLLYAGLVLIFAISFYRDPFTSNLAIASKTYLFFIVPSYLLYATNNPGEFEKEITAYLGLYLGVMLIISYYVAILGINLAYHYFLLPLLVVGYALIRVRIRKGS